MITEIDPSTGLPAVLIRLCWYFGTTLLASAVLVVLARGWRLKRQNGDALADAGEDSAR
jgi:hypothetical protein